MRLALLDPTGLVVNVILADDDYTPPDGLTAVELTDACGPGWTHREGGGCIAPPPPPPGPPSTDARLQAQIDELTDLVLSL